MAAAPAVAQPDDKKGGDAKNDGDKPPGDGPDGDAPDGDGEPAEPPPPTPEELEQAREAFGKGAELFDAGEYDEAVKQFKLAYRLSRNALLLYNIGYTLDEMGNKRLALFYFQKFLRDAPEDDARRKEVKRSVKLLERELAVEDGGGEPSDTNTDGGDTTPPEAAPIDEFMHKVVEEAPPGKPLDITAFIPDGADWQVKLFFRAASEAKFTSTDMLPRYNELVGRIPASKTNGNTIQYYIECRDKTGALVAGSGKSRSPHLVFVDPDAKPIYYPDLTNDRTWEGAGTGDVGGGGGNGNGGGGDHGGGGGFTDIGSSKFRYAKLGSTIGAATFLGLAITFRVLAANKASALEGEAALSRMENCPSGPPCRAFSQAQKDLENAGNRYTTWANVTFGLGVVSAGIAGYLWYTEIMEKKKGESSSNATSFVPVIDSNTVGAAALFNF